jgi:deoxyribodipyrimidine photolyase-related protein
MQRRRTGILMEADGTPAGGKWSFDEENRKRIPAELTVPERFVPTDTGYMREAEAYVRDRFPNAPGRGKAFAYPVTHEDAEALLQHFLNERFRNFGVYEDAMRAEDGLLFHSCLTPALNIGLLTPEHVVSETLAYAERHDVPLNSVEGFIRQIIGWREFIRGVYISAGRNQRTRNAFDFHRKMPHEFWTGTTGLLPADTVIRRVLDQGYCHHIERLMVLGCLMLLCEIDPDQVYEWFMALFVDANDWVMVPNVYGMSQFADGGLMSTKPYICGSAYLRKMGDWKPGPWTDIWDGLYWRFIDRHREVFRTNQRFGVAPAAFDKMDPVRRTHLMECAETFLSGLN